MILAFQITDFPPFCALINYGARLIIPIIIALFVSRYLLKLSKAEMFSFVFMLSGISGIFITNILEIPWSYSIYVLSELNASKSASMMTFVLASVVLVCMIIRRLYRGNNDDGPKLLR